MVSSAVWSVAAMGGVVVAGTVLAGCGSGSGAGHGSGLVGSSAAASTATTAVAATTVPVAATTAPAPTPTPATTAPSTDRLRPTPVTGAGSTGVGPVLIVRSFDGTISYDATKPSTIGFSGDSSNIVTHLSWSSWGPATAVGQGMLGINDCKPNCAAGTVTQVPATVVLSQAVSGHFTAMTEKAGTLDRSYSYPSNWATSAS